MAVWLLAFKGSFNPGPFPPFSLTLDFVGLGAADLAGFDGWFDGGVAGTLIGDNADGVTPPFSGANYGNGHALGVSFTGVVPWRMSAQVGVGALIADELDYTLSLGQFSFGFYQAALTFVAVPAGDGNCFLQFQDNNGADSGVIDVGNGIIGDHSFEVVWDGSVYSLLFDGLEVWSSAPSPGFVGSASEVALTLYSVSALVTNFVTQVEVSGGG